MSAVLSAPFSAKKPIEAILAEVSACLVILRDTRADLEVFKVIPAPESVIFEYKARERNCLFMLRALRAAAMYELDSLEEAA